MTLFTLAVFAITSKYIFSPMRRLKNDIRQLADGHYDSHRAIHEETLDFQEISEQFKASQLEIKDYVHKLRNANHQLTAMIQNLETIVEERTAAKTRFLAMASHEIRTPLHGIISSINLLEKTELTQEQLSYLHLISFSGASLLDVVNDVMDYSRGREKSIAMCVEPFDPILSLTSAFEICRDAKSNMGVASTLKTPRELDFSVLGDEKRVRQIFFNVIGNAFKFTTSGRVDVWMDGRHEK